MSSKRKNWKLVLISTVCAILGEKMTYPHDKRSQLTFENFCKMWMMEFINCLLLFLNVTCLSMIPSCSFRILILSFFLSQTFQDLAFDLSLSALLGDNIYNFGELLAHPIVRKIFARLCFHLSILLALLTYCDIFFPFHDEIAKI